MEKEIPPATITVIAQKENYSVDAFMEAFSVSRNTTYEEMRNGNLRFFKYNSRTFITHEDAKEWLKKVRESGERRILPSNRFKKKKD